MHTSNYPLVNHPLYLLERPVDFKAGCPQPIFQKFTPPFISQLQFRSAIYMHFVAAVVQKHLTAPFIRGECYC